MSVQTCSVTCVLQTELDNVSSFFSRQLMCCLNIPPDRFLFEGRDIKINPNCGVFITMNPR